MPADEDLTRVYTRAQLAALAAANANDPSLPKIPGVTNLRPLDQGGQARVFAGTHARGQCVVKLVDARAMRSDVDLGPRLEREVETLASTLHPAVVQLWDAGLVDGRPYAVLERVPGTTLAREIQRGPVPLHLALAWAQQLFEALAALHDHGVAHRDIKPANLMVQHAYDGSPGRLRLLDFGVVKRSRAGEWTITSTDTVVGTPRYFSPETYREGGTGSALDLWAAAAVLYELVTPGGAAQEVRPPAVVRPVGAPEVVAPLLETMLAMDPAERFVSGHAAARAVGHVLAEVGG